VLPDTWTSGAIAAADSVPRYRPDMLDPIPIAVLGRFAVSPAAGQGPLATRLLIQSAFAGSFCKLFRIRPRHSIKPSASLGGRPMLTQAISAIARVAMFLSFCEDTRYYLGTPVSSADGEQGFHIAEKKPICEILVGHVSEFVLDL